MSLDGQVERLCALYDVKSDDELQAMYEDRDDLTEVAQGALADTMRARGLVGRAAAAVVPEVNEEDEVLESQGLRSGEVKLYTFENAFEAEAGLRVLDHAGIWHRLSSYSSAVMRERGQVPVELTAIVRQVDLGAAVELLRAKMGLLPKPEAGDGLASPLAGMQEMVLVAMFDRSDGLIAAEALGRAGISYCWRGGAEEEEELPDDRTVAIEVAGGRLEMANKVVETALAGRPAAA